MAFYSFSNSLTFIHMQLLALQINAEKYYFNIRKSLVEFDEVLEVRMLYSLGHYFVLIVFNPLINQYFCSMILIVIFCKGSRTCNGLDEAIPCTIFGCKWLKSEPRSRVQMLWLLLNEHEVDYFNGVDDNGSQWWVVFHCGIFLPND